MLTSCSGSSPLILLLLCFLHKSNVSLPVVLHQQFAKINTQLRFFKPSGKTVSKVLVQDLFLLPSFCFFGSSPVSDCSLVRTLFLDDFTSKKFAILAKILISKDEQHQYKECKSKINYAKMLLQKYLK